jgi:hypothetical protein
MNRRINIGFVVLLGAAAYSGEPPARVPAVKPAPAAAVVRAPLKLQVGDVRKYMMPNEFRDSVTSPDADKTTIVVQGDRPAPLLQSEQPLPQGLPAYLALFTHPTNAWRLFLPDPRGIPAGPPDPVPQREFRWGP